MTVVRWRPILMVLLALAAMIVGGVGYAVAGVLILVVQGLHAADVWTHGPSGHRHG